MPDKQPKWVTPERQQHLVNLFQRSRGFCVFGHKNCPIPEHHYIVFIDGLIKDWRADDRARELALWHAERQRLHSLGETRYPIRGRFNNISRDIFFPDQPIYYVLGFGISGLTLKPFAKVRLSSGFNILWVELDKMVDVSKNRKRKAIRHGKRLPELEQYIKQAVYDYLK